jgi:transposase
MMARKKRRRAKTDRIDMEKLLRMLIRYHAGDEDVWSFFRIPSTGAEDRQHLHRDRWTHSRERTKHTKRIKGLLAAQGIGLSLNGDLPKKMDQVRTWDGPPLSPGLKERLLREHERLQLVEQHMKAIEQEQRQAIREPDHTSISMVRDLMRLRSIRIHTAWPLVMELPGPWTASWAGCPSRTGISWRQFQNSREIGALVGLEPIPYQSGETSRDKGMSKCGNTRLHSLAVEFACRLAPACRRFSRHERCQWLIHQPDSELIRWYEKRFGKGSSRVRKIGIVALARKLLIALWRYLETGEIPKRAVLKVVTVRPEDGAAWCERAGFERVSDRKPIMRWLRSHLPPPIALRRRQHTASGETAPARIASPACIPRAQAQVVG